MSDLNLEQVKKIAKLSNLEFSDSELQKLSSELSEVIDYNIDKLNKVDTTKVDPLLNVAGLVNSTREDVTEAGLSQDQALQNAKDKHNGFFRVKQILDQS